jgi:lambda repressor-like predicted transcriptional regulator
MDEHPAMDSAFQEAVRREALRLVKVWTTQGAAAMESALREQLNRLDGLEATMAETLGEQLVERDRIWTERLDLASRDLQRRIAGRLHQEGHSLERIARWLDLSEETLRDWLPEPHRGGQAVAGTEAVAVVLRDACLDYQDQGRGGTIRFVGGKTAFTMWWEYAGGAATALIGIPSGEEWEARTGIPLSLRDEVLAFIGGRILRDKMGGKGRWAYEGLTLTIYP